ncbi:MAG: hypothetical protein FJ279_27830, partial [Planctomycetes bacterium]|nr:hypothetical protein [Planctomycetota bacterium]
MEEEGVVQERAQVSETTRCVRALLVGTAMVLAVNWFVHCSDYVLRSSRICFGYLTMGALIPFLFVVVVNGALKLINRRWALPPDELIVVCIMASVSSIFPALGLTGFLLSLIATPYYFASNQNQWDEYLHPYLPAWAVPSNEGGAMAAFFNGLGAGERIPWDVWITPLLWWSCLIAAVFVACFCISVILRKQWVERERLVFPLAEVPLELVRESPGRSRLPVIMRQRLFLIGFSIPALIILWNLVTYFFPGFPEIPIGMRFTFLSLGRGFPWVCTKFNFFVIGFAFFTNLDVLFSVWFFHLLILIQTGIFNRIGYTIGPVDVWCGFTAATGWETFGAFVFFVVWGLWMARHHLREVVRKAWDRRYPVDDSGELVSYRTAVVCLALSTTFVFGWFRVMGMSWAAILVYSFATLCLYVGITKIVAQCGLVYIRGTLTAQHFTTYVLGTNTLSPAGMSGLLYTYTFCCDARSSVMCTFTHAAKMSDSARLRRGTVLAGLLIASALGFVSSVIYNLYLGYQVGAYNFGAWEFQSGNVQIFASIVEKIRNPVETDWPRLGFFGGGAAVMAFLTFMKYRFIWWPLHPIGLAVGDNWAVWASAFSIFVTWLAKLVILRVGGIR